MNLEYKVQPCIFKKEFIIQENSKSVFVLVTNAPDTVVEKTIRLLIETENKSIHKLATILVNLDYEAEYRLIKEVDFSL